MIDTGGGYNIYFNTVNMNTNQTAAGSVTAALNIAAAVTTVGSINLRDNILADTQTIGTRYAVYNSSTAGATIFAAGGSNYNDYFAQNVGFQTSAQATLANWQAATGQDANSKSVDPLFVTSPAPADLHLQAGSTLVSMGQSIAGINNDFDNDLRDSTPDIGADEIVMSFTGTVPAGTYRDAFLSPGATLGGPVTITGTLTLGGSAAYNGSGNTLTIACGASISGAGPFNYFTNTVIRKDFCAPGSFTFPVGGNYAPVSPDGINPWTPVTANVTALGQIPSSLSVSTTDAFLTGSDTTNSASRYWTLTETGDLTADLSFTYADADVVGNEALYKVMKREGGITRVSQSSTNNTATNTASITGVSNFSDWGVGRALAVAASIDIAGRVTTVDGSTGIPKTRVTISGSTLTQPRVVMTSPMGYYQFDDLPVGTYILTVEAKQYTFSVPARVITANDNITNADFIANE
jgi:hypothetical protein